MKRKTPDKQIKGLKVYAEEKKKQMEENINRVIDQMKKEGKRISFSSVAERSGVSRTTLYNHERIRERIRGLAALSPGEEQDIKELSSSGKTGLSDRIKMLKEQVKKLESDKAKLLIELSDYYELKKENEQLRRQLEKRQRKEDSVLEEEGRDDNK